LLDLLPKDERDSVDAMTNEVIQEAKNGSVDAAKIRTLSAQTRKLHELLLRNVNDLPTSQFIEAKRFLNSFDDALRVLRQPDAGNYFTGKYAAEGGTVDALVKNMTNQGLLFAPATSGDESAYLALQRALAMYDSEAQRNALTATPEK
jgi:hypothetical protein